MKQSPKRIEGNVFKLGGIYRSRKLEPASLTEDVGLVWICNLLLIGAATGLLGTFDSTPRRQTRILHLTKTRDHGRQSQTMMDNFKQSVITIAQNAVVEFHYGPTPQVCLSILCFMGHYVREDVIEKGGQLFRRLPCLRRIFRKIFQNRPQIQERAPIQIPKIGQQ